MKINRMNAARALLCAFALIVVTVPMGGVASANHTERTLDLTPENHNNPVGDRHNVVASLSLAPDTESGPITISFEITGDGDPGPSGPGSGIPGSMNTPDGDSPETPDRTCVIDSGATQCRIFYRSSVVGPGEIRGWIDHDATLEADMSEGWAEKIEPGAVPEPDITDVVRTKWYVAVAQDADLSCFGNRSSQPQDEENAVTCTLEDGTGSGLAGWKIDAENLAGANDPDNSVAFDGVADYNDLCTTGADGKCTADIPTEGEAGAAKVCFWIDEDDDPSFHAGPKRDGSQCDDPEPAPGADQGSHHSTAFAVINWFAMLDDSAVLTCDSDADIRPSSRSLRDQAISCALSDDKGPVDGVQIDAEVLSGANDPTDSGPADYDNVCVTGSDGECDAQITVPDLDVDGAADICFWADENQDDGFNLAGRRWDGGECDTDQINSSDVVSFQWAPAQRSITLTASQPVVLAGKPITLSGQVASDVSDCIDGVEVNLQRAVGDTGVFETVGPPVFTDEAGNYSTDLSSKVSASYRAVLPRTDCAEAISRDARVDARKKLMMNSDRDAVRQGRIVRLRAKVLSCTDGVSDRVVLSKRVSGAFKKLGAKRTNANCVAVFKRKINKRSVFKAYSPQDADQLAGSSSRVVVRLR